MSLDAVGRAKDDSTLTLVNPLTGKPLQNDDGSDMTITVYGEFSQHYRDALYEQTEARIEKSRQDGVSRVPYKDLEAETFELICRVTKDWCLSTDEDGLVPLTPENVRRIYTDYPWVYRQVRGHLEVSANFLDRPETT